MTAALMVSGSAQQEGRGQAPAGGPPGPPVRTITQVTPNLYKVNTGAGVAAVTVFLVTPEGIVLADPLNPETAAWLRGELSSRFPGRPVKWVVQSHFHYDHARGGGLFEDTATFVAHENMRKNLRAPVLAEAFGPGDSIDRDGDNRLSKDEAPLGAQRNFERYDTDRDGLLSGDELYADVHWPGVVFKERYTITLGGQHVELIWAKNRHTSDMLDVYFPEERVLFAGDYVWINRVCCGFDFDRRPMSTWIESIRALESLDFDVLVNSHYEQGTKADLVAFRQWLEDLQAAVSAGITSGASLEELQRTIRLDKYKGWAGYDMQLPAMIQSAYNSLTKYSRN
jgi:glyoxylase-like metal-dependent hydrolase (beta-lactamase superfamily II)